jgi:TolB-like protein/Tfp pilus assembly protein PilF
VGVAYLITAWVLLQIADLVLQNIHAPDWVIQAFMLALGLGFPVVVIFAWAFEMTPEGIKKEKDVDRTQSITSKTGRKLDFTIIGVLAVAVVLLLADRFTPGSEDKPGAPTPSTSSQTAQRSGIQAPAAPKAKSVAVLPFVNMSSDPEQEYFSDGISEEILNALAQVKDLKVAGRTSSFAFKGQNLDLRQIGETLGVENILEGSVRKSGSKVRITAQLIQVEDGFHLWSDTFDRELDDVFAIQDEIASNILEQLKAHLLEGEQAALVATRANSEAYDLYLLAKQRIYERSKPTLEAAAELLDKAIAIDAGYAPAYAQRGITAILLSDEDYGTIPTEQAVAQAKLYIDQALRLDPGDAEAWAGLGLYYLNRPGKTAESIEALDKALSINPNLVDASNWLQAAYGRAGRLAEAMRILEQLVERDPLYRPGISNITGFYVNTGKVDQALALIERIRPSMPNDPFLFRMEAEVLYAQAKYAQGLRMAEQALALRPDHYPNQGQVGQGLLLTGQYERLAEEGHPWQRVIALHELGRLEEATLLAREQAKTGSDVATLIGLLVNSGQQQSAVQFIEQRWADLDAFEADFPLLGDSGPGVMLDIAFAYASSGNEQRFNDAMRRFRQAMDGAIAMGYSNNFMPLVEAVYAALAGDNETAIKQLAAAVDQGLVLGTRFARAWAALKPLEGDPAFEAIQARMIEHLNAERAELGLEPILT